MFILKKNNFPKNTLIGDGDGQLSYREFIAILKDRLRRGLKVRTFNLTNYKCCVKILNFP